MTASELIKAARERVVTQADIDALRKRVKEQEEEFAKREATRKPSLALLRKPFASL